MPPLPLLKPALNTHGAAAAAAIEYCLATVSPQPRVPHGVTREEVVGVCSQTAGLIHTARCERGARKLHPLSITTPVGWQGRTRRNMQHHGNRERGWIRAPVVLLLEAVLPSR